MKKLGLVILLLICVTYLMIPLSLCSQIMTATCYIDTFDDLNGAYFHDGVMIANDSLMLKKTVVGMEYALLNMTNGTWGCQDVNYTVTLNQSVANVSFVLNDSQVVMLGFDYTVFFIANTTIDLSESDTFEFNVSESNRTVLNYLAFIDDFGNVSVDYLYHELSNEYLDFNRTINLGKVKVIAWNIGVKESYLTKTNNYTVSFKGATFGNETIKFYNNGTFVTNGIHPYAYTKFLTLTVDANSSSDVKVYVSHDRTEWFEVPLVSTLVCTSMTLPLYITINLSNNVTNPSVYIMVLTFVSCHELPWYILYNILLFFTFCACIGVSFTLVARWKRKWMNEP